MKRIIIVGACAIAMATIGTTIALAVSGKSGLYGLSSTSPPTPAPTPPGSSGKLFALEQAALTRQGLSPEHAYRAIGVQSTIAESGITNEIEAAMANIYGGMWFEPATAKLHIGVTSPASRRTAEGIVARAGLMAAVIMTPVRSTWAELLAAQAHWNSRLADLLARNDAQTGLAPQSNAVVLTLSASVPTPELVALKHEASTARANIDISVVPNQQLIATRDSSTTECNKFKTGAAYCNKTITSGVTIVGETFLSGGLPRSKVCTAGPLAISKTKNNETYLLTAGHCLHNPNGVGSPWYAYNRSGESKEIGPVAEFLEETKVDVGAIKINNPGYWVSTKANDPVFADTAEWTKESETSYPVAGERTPVVGYTNCHEGQTSGQQCGTVTKLNQEVIFNSGEISTGIVVDTAIAEEKDSGGPWLFITTKANEALMEGTHEGSERTNRTPSYYYPLATLFQGLSKMNLELLTVKNEVRP